MGMELDKINAVNRALPMAMVDRIYMFVFGRRINIAEVRFLKRILNCSKTRN